LKSLLIVGGTGFFGKSLIDLFNNNKLKNLKINKLIITSRKKKFLKNDRIIFLKSDISSAEDLPYADYIIYAAASTDLTKYKKKLNQEIYNIKKGIINFLKILKNKKFKSTKILFCSSGAVYGQITKKIILSENYKLANNFKYLSKEKREYAKAKIFSEKKIINFAKKNKINFSIARCFAFIGPHLPRNKLFFMGNLLNNILKKKKIIIKSNVSKYVYRSYMHSDDLITCLCNIIKKSSIKTPIYNVGSDIAYNLFKFGRTLSETYSLKLIYPKQSKKELKLDYYVPCIKKLKKHFHFKSSFFLNDFQKTIDMIQ
jgi:dTDP-glucose 4,6-dehydratase